MKLYVFVCGVDYPTLSHPGNRQDFGVYAKNRMKAVVADLLRNGPTHERVEFAFFLFRTGETLLYTLKSGAKEAKELTRSELFSQSLGRRGVDSDDYIRLTDSAGHKWLAFRQDNPPVLSVLDVYAYIGAVGRGSPRTIVEVSFFSHGDPGGPVLLNCFERGLVPARGGTPGKLVLRPENERDPADKDPREYDFSGNLKEGQLSAMAEAFAANGCIWTWGCSYPGGGGAELVSRIAAAAGGRGLERTRKYQIKQAAASPDKPITLLQKFAAASNYVLPKDYNVDGWLLIAFLCDRFRVAYGVKFTDATGVASYVTPYGLDARPDGPGHERAFAGGQALHVGTEPAAVVQLYKKTFEPKYDPEGRGYIRAGYRGQEGPGYQGTAFARPLQEPTRQRP